MAAPGRSRPWMATNFFPSRKRCCPECLTRTIKVHDQEVTEYYHPGVICHLVGHELALPLDLELLRPGEGEETAAKRLLERVFADYPRFFDVVVGDALYLDAPFINFCLAHHKHAIVVVKGDQRLLLQDAQGLFAQAHPNRGTWDAAPFKLGTKKASPPARACSGRSACSIPRRRCSVGIASPANGRPWKRPPAGIGPPPCPKTSSRRPSCGAAVTRLGCGERLLQHPEYPLWPGPLL